MKFQSESTGAILRSVEHLDQSDKALAVGQAMAVAAIASIEAGLTNEQAVAKLKRGLDVIRESQPREAN